MLRVAFLAPELEYWITAVQMTANTRSVARAITSTEAALLAELRRAQERQELRAEPTMK